MADNKSKKTVKKKRGLQIPLWFKFTAAVVGLILLIFGTVGYFVFEQQSRDLGGELRQRGLTVAENLASNARDSILGEDEIGLAKMARDVLQAGSSIAIAGEGFDLTNAEHLLAGVTHAMVGLPQSAQRYFNDVGRQFGFDLGLGGRAPELTSVNNEGVFEVIIHNRMGVVMGHSDISQLGSQYQRPEYLTLPSEEDPYPVYQQTYDDNNEIEQIRHLYDIEVPVVVNTEEGSTEVGKVHVGLSKEIVDRAVFESTTSLMAIGVIVVLGGAMVTLVFVNFLVRPVGKLLTGVLEIAGGNFNTRIRVAARDELGALTLSFNNMAKSLSENEMLKGAFSRYVSDAALEQLLNDPSKTGLHGRRVTAAIYSSDVRGFTKMSETLEPEEVVDVINTYLSLQTDIILKYQGVVDKFIGDATIGVFGKEEQRKDDTLRCVKAAVEIQHEIAMLNVQRKRENKVPKDIGIGINTGEIIAGNIGSAKKMEYTISGDDAMLADQLCDECPAGKVWITQATYDLVKNDVRVKKVPPLNLKGKSAPVTVYEVVQLSEV